MDNDDYLTNEQIETAKRKLGIKNIREQEITSDFVHTLSFWWASAVSSRHRWPGIFRISGCKDIITGSQLDREYLFFRGWWRW